MTPGQVERVLRRACRARGGDAARAAASAWDVALAVDEGGRVAPVRFRDRFALAERPVRIDSDAPLASLSPAGARQVAAFHADLARALAREAVAFSSETEVIAFLARELGARGDEGPAVFGALARVPFDSWPVEVLVKRMGDGEEWVVVATGFRDAPPEWLLDRSGMMAAFHFGGSAGSYVLETALPLALVTGERLVELVHDVRDRAAHLDEVLGYSGAGGSGSGGRTG